MKNNPGINTVQGKTPAAEHKIFFIIFRFQKPSKDMIYTLTFRKSKPQSIKPLVTS